MNEMKFTISVHEKDDLTDISTRIDGEISRRALAHAVAHFLTSVYKSTKTLAVVTEGIEEFMEMIENEDK